MRRAVRIGIAVALGIALFALGGAGVFGLAPTSEGSASAPPPGATAPTLVGAAPPNASLPGLVASLQEQLRQRPNDPRLLASLGLAYVQQARIAADPSLYPKAQQALERSLSAQPEGNEGALIGMGALALARHGFAEALRWGRRAVELDPYAGTPYGVKGDALLELGRYRKAFATFQTMVDTKPDVSSYARVSYARELAGDVDGAMAAMEMARDAAGTPEDAAWASHQLGELALSNGRIDLAARSYRRAIELAPSFVPPHAGLAKVAWARGRVEDAVRRMTWVVDRYPMPEYVVALGDLYAVMGRPDLAEQRYDLARAERELLQADGVVVDLELALFDADHGAPRRALRAARGEWARRSSVHVADALAWALHANGRDAEALRFSRFALRLGTRNASFLYHAAMIRLALGDRGSARRFLSEALAIDPHFSILHADSAAALLERLGGRR